MGNHASHIEPTKPPAFLRLHDLQRQPDHTVTADHRIHYIHPPTMRILSWNYREHEWEQPTTAKQLKLRNILFSPQ